MKIKERNFTKEQLNSISELSKEFGITELTLKILYGRGYTDKESIEKFLNPSKDNFISPYFLSGVEDAVKRITLARDNNETVVVYGDYDADGICATTILYKALKIFGIDAYTVIPERENGYGLSESVINEVIDNYFPDLIITVDCGISAKNEVEYLKDLGVDVIVTDHHEIPEELPDCTVINCKLKNQEYSFDGLCGAGVAYKLSYALIGEDANQFLDLVSVATVADSMPLIGENRDIVKEGLEIIKRGESDKPLKTLLNLTGVKDITASSLGYSVAPRINAAGRMGDAYSCLKLFLSTNFGEIDELSKKLLNYNVSRQTECEKLYEEVKERLKTEGIYKNVIVLYGSEWMSGLVGIVASKIADEYYLPTILFTKSGDNLHGSARSIDGINVYNAIASAEEYIINFGGHSQAAGVTIKESDIENFAKKLSEHISSEYDDEVFERTLIVDGILDNGISFKTARELQKLEPCGIANKKPIFAVKVENLRLNVIKDVHLSFNHNGFDYIYFNSIKNLELLKSKDEKTLIYEPNLSSYNGRDYLKGYVKTIADVKASNDDESVIRKSILSLLENNETSLDLSKISVDRLEVGKVYTVITEEVKMGNVRALDVYKKHLGKFTLEQFIFSIEVFKELGLIIENEYLYVNKSVKSQLTNSKIYVKVSNLKSNYDRN